MNREEAKVVSQYLRVCPDPVGFRPLVDALADGENVQIHEGGWQSRAAFCFNAPLESYRIFKPPAVRPFESGLEAMTALASNGPWLKRKGQSEWCLVTRVRDMGLTIMGRVYGFEELLDTFEFKNGPCGIEL